MTGVSTSFAVVAPPAAIATLAQAMALFDAHVAGRLAPGDLVDAAIPPREGGMRGSGLRRALEAHADAPLGLTIETNPDGAVVSGSGSLNLAGFAELARVVCPEAMPLAIAWRSETPAPPLGGWIAVMPDRVVHGDVAEAARAEIARLSRRRPPTALQTAAAAAYAVRDDGAMAAVLADPQGEPIEDALRAHPGTDLVAALIHAECQDAGDDADEAARMLRTAAQDLEDVARSIGSRP